MITVKEIRKGFPHEKYVEDTIWLRLLRRPLSFYLAAKLINAKWSANHVSFLSLGILVIGLALFVPANYITSILGSIFLNLYMLFDTVDGNIARATNTRSKYGEFLETVNGYLINGFSYLAIGWAVGHSGSSQVFGFEPDYVLLGALTGICNFFIRVVHLKSQMIFNLAGGIEENIKEMNIGKRFDREIAVSGFYHPAVSVCAILDKLHYFTIFYFIYYLSSSVFFITTKLIKYRKCL